jgi:signal recognition particle GTPase
MTTPFTFAEMRANLIRHRDGKPPAEIIPGLTDRASRVALLNRMIALIDAMTPEERTLSNVITFSPARLRELASTAGVELRDVQGVIAGRQAVEFTRNVYHYGAGDDAGVE